MVVVHGGGFSGGSKTQSNVVAWSRAFASRGFLVASIDYRLSGTRPIPSARVRPLYDAVLAGDETPQEVAYTEPPIFLAHATGDPTVAYSQSTTIAARASAVGLDHVLYTKNANVHGFDLAAEVFEPGTSVLEAQVDFVTCQMYPHVANAPECS